MLVSAQMNVVPVVDRSLLIGLLLWLTAASGAFNWIASIDDDDDDVWRAQKLFIVRAADNKNLQEPLLLLLLSQQHRYGFHYSSPRAIWLAGKVGN